MYITKEYGKYYLSRCYGYVGSFAFVYENTRQDASVDTSCLVGSHSVFAYCVRKTQSKYIYNFTYTMP